MGDEPLVETVGLGKCYGARWAVRNLALRVPRGTVYGLLGPNGAGKSTTIRLLLGLVRASEGEVRLFGRSLARERLSLLGRVGFMVEGPAFWPYLSAERNLLILGELAGGTTPEEVQKALGRVGLGDRAKDLYKGFSTGMRQRLGIAAALLHNPELVILDEPLNGLDPPAILLVRQLIQDLAKKEGRTVLVSSHQLHEVELSCERVAILRKGQMVMEGAVAELLKQTARVEVATAEPAQALALAKGLAFVTSAVAQDGTLLVELPDERRAELNAALCAAGIPVSALVPRRRTLEELFHEQTGTEVTG